jgi:hypothetical protein
MESRGGVVVGAGRRLDGKLLSSTATATSDHAGSLNVQQCHDELVAMQPPGPPWSLSCLPPAVSGHGNSIAAGAQGPPETTGLDDYPVSAATLAEYFDYGGRALGSPRHTTTDVSKHWSETSARVAAAGDDSLPRRVAYPSHCSSFCKSTTTLRAQHCHATLLAAFKGVVASEAPQGLAAKACLCDLVLACEVFISLKSQAPAAVVFCALTSATGRWTRFEEHQMFAILKPENQEKVSS